MEQKEPVIATTHGPDMNHAQVGLVAISFLIASNIQPFSTWNMSTFALGCVLFIAFFVVSKQELKRHHGTTPVILVCALVASSFLWSSDQDETLQILPGFLIATVLALLLARLEIQVIAWGMFWGAVIALILSWVSVALVPEHALISTVYNFGAIQGILNHSNTLGQMAVYGLITTVALRHSTTESLRLVLGFLIFVYIYTIYRTNSSSAMLVSLIVCVIYFLYILLRRVGTQLRVVLLLLSGIVLLLGYTYALTVLFPRLVEFSGRDLTFTGRTGIWEAAFPFIERSLFFGFGMGGVWGAESPIGQAISYQAGFSIAHAHNGYLDILLNIGLTGLVLFLWIIIKGLTHTTKLSLHDNQYTWMSLLLIALLLFNLSESPFLKVQGWFILVLLYTASQNIPRLGGKHFEVSTEGQVA